MPKDQKNNSAINPIRKDNDIAIRVNLLPSLFSLAMYGNKTNEICDAATLISPGNVSDTE
tara:strand:+ start:598 stop:777 length:180 start_codon:yes stop_codon:yes gene_type:complete